MVSPVLCFLIVVPPFPCARNASRLKDLPLAFTMNVLFELWWPHISAPHLLRKAVPSKLRHEICWDGGMRCVPASNRSILSFARLCRSDSRQWIVRFVPITDTPTNLGRQRRLLRPARREKGRNCPCPAIPGCPSRGRSRLGARCLRRRREECCHRRQVPSTSRGSDRRDNRLP